MRNDTSTYRRFVINAFYFFVVIVLVFACHPQNKCAYAETIELENQVNDNISDILENLETEDLDEFLTNDIFDDYYEIGSFKDFVLNILSGDLFLDFNSFFDYLLNSFQSLIKNNFSFILSIFVMIILYEIFSSICVNKYFEFKKTIKFVFSIVITIYLVSIIFNIKELIVFNIEELFRFANIIFPLLLGLMISSGATTSFSVYSSMSVFLLNTGLYIFKFILMPIAISILIFSLFELLIQDNKFDKLINLLKYIFKMILTILFSIFGMFSVINIISSGMKDGLSLKITKYAIKNYVPILGGYISEGFDFVKTCSVLVKNSLGVGGLFILFFNIAKPFLLYLSYIISFKILAVFTLFIGNQKYANVFEKVSNGMSYVMSILIGVFLIILVFIFLTIMSVSVI